MGYAVIYDYDGGAWGAHSPDFPGCIASADTQDECRRLFTEALALHIEGLREDGIPIPDPHSGVESLAA